MMTIEMSPVFVLLCCYRLTFIVSLPAADLYSRLLILLIFTNLNPPAMNYSNRRLHPVQSTNDIWYGQFILADTAGKRFLAGANKCKQLRRFWWRCLPPLDHQEPIATRSRDLVPNGHAQGLEMEETRMANNIAIKYSKFNMQEACRSLNTDRV